MLDQNQNESLQPPATPAPVAIVPAAATGGEWVNDVHSLLNATRVHRVEQPDSVARLQSAIKKARREQRPVSIAAGRGAMGGQQFGTDGTLIDMNALNAIIAFDRGGGRIEVGAGIQWPELIRYLREAQSGEPSPWGIIQKQTGGDRLSIGGSLAANAHGRGLDFKPMVADVEAFTLVDANGRLRHCSRSEHPELFRLSIGGYGLFGVIATVTLRLAPRQRLQRCVEIVAADELPGRFQERIDDGFLYGDFQFCTHPNYDAFLNQGVFSCYRPVPEETAPAGSQKMLSEQDWLELLRLAHVDKARAWEMYMHYYRSTHGQLYWSDTHQLSTYIDGYHQLLGDRIGQQQHGTEMITEIYVPRDALPAFLKDVREDFRRYNVDLIYGTIRLIRRDDETFLAWAKQDYACVIFNLHTQHTPGALQKTQADFRRLIERGIRYGGSYFLTYHRWATPGQVQTCYPQFREFLRLKKHHDPEERFQSDWYRHYRAMFAEQA
ncbi:MAG: FAD-binding oxidoreductase [Pseudomonadota bacterium]